MSTDFLDSLDTGTRVVLRYRLAPGEQGQAGERMSDVLGYLLAVDEHSGTVQTRAGDVQVSRAAITHAKRVPPPPARRRSTPGN